MLHCLPFLWATSTMCGALSHYEITPAEQRRIETLFQNPTAYELSVKLRATFRHAKSKTIGETKFSANPGIGLLGAWAKDS